MQEAAAPVCLRLTRSTSHPRTVTGPVRQSPRPRRREADSVVNTGGPGGLPRSLPPEFCNGKARPLLLPTQPAGLATCKHLHLTREAGAERPLGAASCLQGPVTPRDPSPLQDPVLRPASPRTLCPRPLTSPDPAEGFRPRITSTEHHLSRCV